MHPEWRKSSHSFANGNCAEVAAWRKSTASTFHSNCVEVAGWRKSTASAYNGSCTEVASWRTSTASGSMGDCVEVGHAATVVGVRDSQLGERSPVLTFPAKAWAGFIAQLT